MVAIQELAANKYAMHIDTLLPLLSNTYNLESAIVSRMPNFIELNQLALMVRIIVTSGIDVRKHASYLITEMAYQNAPAKQFDEISMELKKIGITIESDLNVFEGALNSQSTTLMKSILQHMQLAVMPIDEYSFKKWIKCAVENGVDPIEIIIENLDTEKRSTEWRKNEVVFAMVKACLLENDIQTAAQFAGNYTLGYDCDFLEAPLFDAFFRTRDTSSFVQFIFVTQDAGRKASHLSGLASNREVYNYIDRMVDKVVMDKRSNENLIYYFLRDMSNNGLFISKTYQSEIIQQLREIRKHSSRIFLILDKMNGLTRRVV